MFDDQQLRAEAEAFVDEVWEDVVADIDRLVQVESVEDLDHAMPDAPFGPAPREALERALGIAKHLGLATRNCEGYLGFGELAGQREDYLATIAHADIVPLGAGWSYDPLRVTRRDGFLLGRGVLDDKGPLVLSLYAAHFFARKVAQTGEQLPYTLRCLIGSNEETGMADVEYYLEHYPQPVFCFSPDASFPLICGEKGLFSATIESAALDPLAGRIVSMKGGTVSNAIPNEAEAIVRAHLAETPAREDVFVSDYGKDEQGNQLVCVHARGKGGHASMPEGTRNAIDLLVDYLLANDLCTDSERDFLLFERALMADTAGDALGIAAHDEAFGALTCVGGTIGVKRDGDGMRFVQSMDCRYPTSTSGAHIMDTVREVAGMHGCTVSLGHDMAPFYLAPDTPEVLACVDTYNEVTGHDGQAFTIGGGTYARHFARAVAFGPDDPSYPVPEWVGPEHGPNEGVSEASLRRALVIYILAIARLMWLER